MLCLLAVLVASVQAQTTDPQPPQPCCGSHQFTAIIGQTGGYVNNGVPTPIDGFMEMVYDYDAKIMNIEIHTKNLTTGQFDNTSTLMDYNGHKQYYRTEYGCFYDSLDDVMTPPCAPDTATYMARVTLGSGDSSLDTDVWEFTRPGTDNVVKLVLTADTCAPVMQTTYGNMYGLGPRSETLIFTTVKDSITDRSLLVVPRNCQPIPAETVPVGRRSVIFN